MKRTMRYWTTVLAPAALLPLAVACSSRTTQQGTSAPGNEPSAPSTMQSPGAGERPTSRVDRGEGETRGEQGRSDEQQGRGREERERQPALGSGLGQPGSPQAGQGQQGRGQQGAPQGGAMMEEQALCASIASTAKLHVEDVQNGVAIVAAPKGGTNLSTVRDDIRRLEGAMRAGAGAEPHAGRGETCGLAELGRLPNVSVELTEGTSSVRLVMTTQNPGEVKDLRRIAREEIAAMNKGGKPRQMDRPRPHMDQPTPPPMGQPPRSPTEPPHPPPIEQP